MTTEFNESARRLRNAVEPVAAGVYFAPEAHAAYEALGFDPSPAAAQKDDISRPELTSYFTSRGACLGQVPGELVAAAFGCFNPKVVVRASRQGGRSPTGRRSSGLGSRAQPRCCIGFSARNLRAWDGSPSCCAAPRTRLPGRATRCTPDCAHSGSRGRQRVTCGAQRTWCASTGETVTSSPGPSAEPTRWRSCC